MAAPRPISTANQIARAARILKAKAIGAAKVDPKTFAQYVLKDERSGGGIQLSPTHEAWHDLISQHKRLVIWSHIESGKTTQVAIGRLLYEIGRDRTIRAAIVSNTHGQAVKVVRSVARYIEQSPQLKSVWPDMMPDEPWSVSAFTVRRNVFSKDPTVQATGVHGNITGARLDLVIVDDILDYENCLSAQGRQQLWDWLHATLHGRLTENARFIVIGTAYHPDDAMHRYARTPGFTAVRYPVLDDLSGLPRWPERWSLGRIQQKKDELGPSEFARQMLCVARDDASSRFKSEWIDLGKMLGEGKDPAHALHSVPAGYKTVTGVDLAVQQKDGADLTCLFTIIVHPSGQGEKREILCVESGRWSGPEIVQKIVDTHRRYNSLVIVENNAAQDFILQFTRAAAAIPLRAFTTGRNKAHPEFGIESIGAELANGKWVIPNRNGRCHPEIDAWINEMLFYDPRAHTGDRLMASWFAREGVRMSTLKAEIGRIDLMSR